MKHNNVRLFKLDFRANCIILYHRVVTFEYSTAHKTKSKPLQVLTSKIA